MEISELRIQDSYVINPKVHSDSRGDFWEWYRFDQLSEVVGHSLNLRQANASVSAKGALRGIHFAEVQPGQAKYVTCPFGEVLDFVIDIRIDSPTFGQYESVILNDQNRKAVYLSEGLGHAFVALSENATVNYLVSGTYNPSIEHGINPLDPEIGLQFPKDLVLSLSDKDKNAPALSEAISMGMLPTFQEAKSRYKSLDKEGINP